MKPSRSRRWPVLRLGLVAGGALLFAACASTPRGPQALVLPGGGVTFEQFREDDALCRQFAGQQISDQTQGQREAALGSGAVGAAVGALAGAAIGGGGRGAAIGAGSGLLFGGVVGSDRAHAAGGGLQRQYDNAFIQCMYARGHRVPAPAGWSAAPPAYPPQGMPPPPPPR